MPSSAQYRVSSHRLRGAAATVKSAMAACERIPAAAFNFGPAGVPVRRQMGVDHDELQRVFAQLTSLADVLESRVTDALAYEDQLAAHKIASADYAQRLASHEARRKLPGIVSVHPGPLPLRPIPPSFVLND